MNTKNYECLGTFLCCAPPHHLVLVVTRNVLGSIVAALKRSNNFLVWAVELKASYRNCLIFLWGHNPLIGGVASFSIV